MTLAKEKIKQAVIDQLVWDDRVHSTGVEVEVLDGTVRLNGTVPKSSDRKAAEEDALSIPGVQAVENNLRVSPPNEYLVLTDGQIKEQLENQVSSDYRMDPIKVKVGVYDGVVTLDGTVGSYWKKDAVEDLAYSKPGVVDVVNNLSVVPSHSITDERIATEIKDAFKKSVALDGQDITVEVLNGVVTLTGVVSHSAARGTAYEIVSYTPGVIAISNRVEVDRMKEV